MTTIEQLRQSLGLHRHPEGGWFSETFRSPLPVQERERRRAASTAIYFALENQDFSAFHRVESDEVWHHYLGPALDLYLLHPSGELQLLRLGKALTQGERPQAVVPGGVWQAAQPVLSVGAEPVLCGCTVAPGFEFADFELAERTSLIERYPEHRALIERLTREA